MQQKKRDKIKAITKVKLEKKIKERKKHTNI